MRAAGAFVNIRARHSVARVARWACAREGARGVCAIRHIEAIVAPARAFVDLRASSGA